MKLNIIFLIILVFMFQKAEAKDYRNEYKKVLKAKCSFEMKKNVDERELVWGCPKEKTDLLKTLQKEIEIKFIKYLKKNENFEGIKTFKTMNIIWERYSNEAKNFNMNFHTPGSMGTSGRLQSEQFLVKQKIEILLDYIYNYYKIEL